MASSDYIFIAMYVFIFLGGYIARAVQQYFKDLKVWEEEHKDFKNEHTGWKHG